MACCSSPMGRMFVLRPFLAPIPLTLPCLQRLPCHLRLRRALRAMCALTCVLIREMATCSSSCASQVLATLPASLRALCLAYALAIGAIAAVASCRSPYHHHIVLLSASLTPRYSAEVATVFMVVC